MRLPCLMSIHPRALELPALVRVVAAVTIALTGGGVSLAGIIAFRRAKTTVNPMKPDTTSALVCSGISGVTRNPMDVGLLFVLVAWAVFLSSAWTWLGPLAFVLYINRFQIAPEERVLWVLVFIEGRRAGMRHLWAPIAANLAVGVSLGLPLFLYLREQQLARSAGAGARSAVFQG